MAAITSVDKDEREHAAQLLLFMSSYDYMQQTKHILSKTQNNYLRFIAIKALLFVVSNEIGPE